MRDKNTRNKALRITMIQRLQFNNFKYENFSKML